MLIIIDKTTKQIINNMGPNPMYPDGNIPNVILAENEDVVKINDNSSLAQKIIAAEPHSYSLLFDDVGNCIDATVNKTLEQWRQENPPSPQPPTSEERIEALEMAMLALMG